MGACKDYVRMDDASTGNAGDTALLPQQISVREFVRLSHTSWALPYDLKVKEDEVAIVESVVGHNAPYNWRYYTG